MLRLILARLARWLEEYFQYRREERERKRMCDSCESLKSQLSVANEQVRVLTNRVITLLDKPEVEVRHVAPDMNTRPGNRFLAWPARRQILEQEDKKRAILMRQAQAEDARTRPVEAATPIESITETDKLEKEVVNAGQ